ncbi:MAG: Tripartite-type tricarboxylate transporter, receptor component TctC [Pseudomonadota bacterium]|nr:Tripartite-type tricarboxylate transporter, receptor component TctC [Pseudomonadota bacterium]
MTPDRRHFLHTLSAGVLTITATQPRAQNLPESLRLMCGFPPGGSADAISRWMGERLAGVVARSVVVDNRTGAGGRLAIETLKSAPPDGSTLLLTPSSTLAMYPHVYQKLNYDPLADLAPVSQVCDFVHGLAVGAAVPASVRTLPQFIAWCKAHPDQASIANTGDGTMPHFLTILLGRAMGTKIEAVPYKGAAPAINDVIAGQIAAIIAPEGTYTSYLADGKLRLLATSGERRSRFFPNVGTFAEQGAKSLIVGEWFALFAPARTPAALITRAAATITAAVRTEDLQTKLAKFGMSPVGSTPAALGDRLKADLAFWGPVVKSTGFTPLST